MPDDLTQAHGLVSLYALQQWEAFAPRYHDPLAPSYFYLHLTEFLAGLENQTRQTAFKHIVSQQCLVCDASVDLATSVLDHLIARALGGPESVQNSIVLCRRCNSSKGTKDLLEWWLWKSYKVEDLPRNILCLYARMHWQFYREALLKEPLTFTLRAFVHARAALLPTDQHRIALYGASIAACALARWLKDHRSHD